MPPESARASAARSALFEGWPGVVLIAATYVYFLIFAQFGFLKRLAELGIGESALPAVMGAMAVGGIAISLLAPRTRLWNCPSCRLQTGFIGCALTTIWALFPLNPFTAAVVALVIGLSLGLLTVTLVANLPLWIGWHRPLLKIAIGTGLGYFLCNVPPLFTATPRSIAIVSGIVCLLALVVANRAPLIRTESIEPSVPRPFDSFLSKGRETTTADLPIPSSLGVAITIAWFTGLVWLDSAAFFIIQNSPALQAGAWHGSAHLWRTAVLHLLAALSAGVLLARRGLTLTLSLALLALGGACLLLAGGGHAPLAAFLYPAGVSLYSVALVAYPSFLMPGVPQVPAVGTWDPSSLMPGVPQVPAVGTWDPSSDSRARRAGYLYAIAGWIGSGLGIGMARDLHRIPPAFVVLAAALFLATWLWPAVASGRLGKTAQVQALSVAGLLAAAFAGTLLMEPTIRPFAAIPQDNPIELGRQVYVAEGCINCHSQYVRPGTADVAMWGPATDLDAIRQQKPPLIGNRRQGPDLSQVGARRSPLWLRIHFMRPRDVSYGSPMPPYDYLFRNGRGDNLIAYLSSLNGSAHWTAVANWQPSPSAWSAADFLDGPALFRKHCATCHAPDGAARLKWFGAFHRVPPDLATAPLQHVSPQASTAEITTQIARIARFGIQGTDMPGHEYLPDDQIAAIAQYVLRQRIPRDDRPAH